MFQNLIDGQYRRPTGMVGRWVGNKMAEQHRPENAWTVSLLNIQPQDRILEVGFGPGISIHEIAKHLETGHISGIDFSQTMVSEASRLNHAAIQSGCVDLRHGEANEIPYADHRFDKAYSIHSIYFWMHPTIALKELHRVLKPGGILILTILPKEKWNEGDPSKEVGTPECKPYSGAELTDLLIEAGFNQIRIETDNNLEYKSNYSVIGIA